MAKSADDDDKKKDEKDDAAEAPAEEKEAAEAEAKKPAADEADEEEAKPAAPAKPIAKAGAPARKPGARPGLRPGVKKATPAKGGSLGKSVILFVIIVGGIGAAFAVLGREENNGGLVKPKWTIGQTVDVEITLVKTDAKDLACGAAEEIGGKHCQFEGPNKPWSKGETTDDKKILKPYTTTDRMQFVGAGLWADPEMQQDKLPATRFSVKCKYKVESLLKKLDIRWEATGQWFPNQDWNAGSLTDCKVVK